MLVSIIVPVYNAGKYLPSCLDSLVKQRLQEIEIIVVNDGSTDKSGDIADQYARGDSRIRVIHQRNGNPGATRNVGLTHASGEYIGFVDADDWVDPEMFFSLYHKAIESKSDIVVTGVTVEFVRDNRILQRCIEEVEIHKTEISPLDAYYLLSKKNLFAVVYNKLYRTSLLRNSTVRFMEMLPYEDLVFNLRVFMSAPRIACLPDSPYHYICRDEMTAAGSFSGNHLQACKITEKAFSEFFHLYGKDNTGIESFLRARRVSDYSLYAVGFYKKSCLFSRKERLDILRKEFLGNERLHRDIQLSSPDGFYQKMFYFFLFNTPLYITDSFYQFIFCLRYSLDPFYRIFRHLILSK